jgi:hypothetical protein
VAGGQHGLDARHAGEVAIHDPQPPGGEQVPVVLQRLIQQYLLGLALVPAAAGPGRAGHHAQGGAGGGAGDPQLTQLRERGRIVRGARRPERLPVGRAVRHADQRPVDRAHLQVPGRDRAVVPAAVLAVDPGQQPVPQPLQRRRADRLPPGAGHRRGRRPVRPLPRNQDQIPEEDVHRLGVIGVRGERHQEGEPDRQRRAHRPPGRALHPAIQRDGPGDLVNHAWYPAQLIQPLLGKAQPYVISRVPGSLDPPVAAHHRPRHRHRLQPHHQVPGPDPARPGGRQRRPAVPAQTLPRRRSQVSHPDRDHARLPEQAQGGILRTAQGDIWRRDKVKGHQGSRAETWRLVRWLMLTLAIHAGAALTGVPT